jgi:hypothetical protein
MKTIVVRVFEDYCELEVSYENKTPTYEYKYQ